MKDTSATNSTVAEAGIKSNTKLAICLSAISFRLTARKLSSADEQEQTFSPPDNFNKENQCELILNRQFSRLTENDKDPRVETPINFRTIKRLSKRCHGHPMN